MFRQVSFNFFRRYLRSYSSASSSDNKKNWNLVASVCLLRKPLINKDMTDLERRVQELLFRIEEERSWKNDWELQTDIDAQDLQKIKSGKSSKIGRKLCRDWEDEFKAEFNSFKLQSCLTEDDKKHNMKSWNRLLDRTLTLIVQPTDRDNVWFLPQSNRQEGENMREAAERVLRECCGENLKAQFYGNAPCGFYKFKFPKALREKTGIEGEKVFFYKAYLLGGTLKSSPVLRDFKWVAQNELGPSLTSEKYCNSVQRFLFNET